MTPPRKTASQKAAVKKKTAPKKAAAKKKTASQKAVASPKKAPKKSSTPPKLRSFEQSFVDFLEAQGVSYLAYQLQRCSKLTVKDMLARARAEKWIDLLFEVKVEELDELIGVQLPEPSTKPKAPTSTRAMRRVQRKKDVSVRIVEYVAKNRGKTSKQIREALGLGALQASAALNRLRVGKKLKPTTKTPPYKWTVA